MSEHLFCGVLWHVLDFFFPPHISTSSLSAQVLAVFPHVLSFSSLFQRQRHTGEMVGSGHPALLQNSGWTPYGGKEDVWGAVGLGWLWITCRGSVFPSLLSEVLNWHCDMFYLSLGFRDEQTRNFQTFHELSSTCSRWQFWYRCPQRRSWLDPVLSLLLFK